MVAVPDKQLSLAIGKEGQNARLAAKLTGWRIDIKSASAFEAERAAALPKEVIPEVKTGAEVPIEQPELAVEEESTSAEPTEETKEAEPLPITDFKLVLTSQTQEAEEAAPLLRFAEDILPSKAAAAKKRASKSKKDAELKAKEPKPKKTRAKRTYFEEDEGEAES